MKRKSGIFVSNAIQTEAMIARFCFGFLFLFQRGLEGGDPG